MQVNHHILCLVALGAAWTMGCVGAPRWMPAVIASTLVVSTILDAAAQREPRRGRRQHHDVLSKLIGHVSIQIGLLLIVYSVGFALSQIQ